MADPLAGLIERLVALVGVDAEAAIGLEQDHAIAGTQPGDGAAVVGDLATGDKDAHGWPRYSPELTHM